ncbi:MAG TPA: DAK2 domain-containing protein [Firmicutes bacterium]|nr:DAK2 domain-containing protein [Bacillota bacterium]
MGIRETAELDGSMIKALLNSAAALIEKHSEEVNALNVFPVPDGDTGTNMSLTMKSAAAEASRVSSSHAGEVLEAASLGALMGARGNSGVILSQVFRGIAQSSRGKAVMGASDFAQALKQGVGTAYKAVMKPVEGTILTVMREAAAAASAAASANKDISGVLLAAIEAGNTALSMTPKMLPALREAGVVDAGGKGFLFILQGWYGAVSGEAVVDVKPEKGKGGAEPAREEPAGLAYPYDTQFLIKGSGMSPEVIRAELTSLGDCLLVVGDTNLIRVHIHTDHPGEVLESALRYGELHDLEIQNMKAQVGAAAENKNEDKDRAPAGNGEFQKEIGVVAVASGQGLVKVFKSLGTDLVLDGGKTMNPSTQEVLSAVQSVNAKRVIFLPNNENTFLAAKQAKKMIRKRMYVVPSKNIQEGVSALIAMRSDLDVEGNLRLMGKAVHRCTSGEVTYAVRETGWNGLKVKSGDVIGLINGELTAVGSSPEEVLKELVRKARKPEHEVLTVFVGEPVPAGTEKELLDDLSSTFSDLEVEVHRGDQPLHYYLFSLE